MRILSQMGWLWSPSTRVPIMCSMQQTVKVTNGALHEASLKWNGALVQAGSVHQKARQGLAFHSRASQRDSYQGLLLAWGCFDTLFCSTIYKSTARLHHMLHWENNYVIGGRGRLWKRHTPRNTESLGREGFAVIEDLTLEIFDHLHFYLKLWSIFLKICLEFSEPK